MKRRNILGGGVALAGAAAIGLALPGASFAQGEPPVQVGLIAPMSGP